MFDFFLKIITTTLVLGRSHGIVLIRGEAEGVGGASAPTLVATRFVAVSQ